MVNLLEFLYVVTALAGILMLRSWIRLRRSRATAPSAYHRAAVRWTVATAVSALVCLLLYGYLSP